MTVARDFGEIIFHCDGEKCNEYLETDTKDFSEALAVLDDEGWVAVKVGDNNIFSWEHHCPECIGPLYKV